MRPCALLFKKKGMNPELSCIHGDTLLVTPFSISPNEEAKRRTYKCLRGTREARELLCILC